MGEANPIGAMEWKRRASTCGPRGVQLSRHLHRLVVARSRRGGEGAGMRAKILVVDDEADMVELIGFNLRLRDYEVFSASNGLEALLKVRRYRPDLVVLDVMMEGLDGLSVCEILHSQPSTQTTPILIVTAATGEIARMNSLAAGAGDFLTKPFSPGDLVERVGRLLGRAGQARTEETK